MNWLHGLAALIIEDLEDDFEDEDEPIAGEVFSKVVDTINSRNNCYSHELIAWISRNHHIRSEYVNRVGSELGNQDFDFYRVLAMAQFEEMMEVAELVVSYIFEHLMQKV